MWSKGDWRVEDNFSISAPRVDGNVGRVTIAGMKGFNHFSCLSSFTRFTRSYSPMTITNI